MAVAFGQNPLIDLSGKKQIPVVNNIVTEKETEKRDGDQRSLPKLSPPSFSKIIKLLVDKHSVSEIATSCSEKVQREAATSICSLYNLKASRIGTPDTQPVSSCFIKTAIERSTFCKALTKCYGKTEDLETRLELARAMRNLSDSSLNCDDILSASGAGLICSSLNMPDPSKRLLFLCVEILWNLLEFGSEEDVMNQLNCDECIHALQTAFVDRLRNCSGHADRQLRNDLLVLSILVASRCPGSPFIETGFVKVLSLLSAYPEVPSNSELVRNLKIQQTPEDFELKKLFFDMVLVLSKDPAALPIMSEQRVVLGLFSYIRPINENLKTNWTPAQYEELQLQALFILSSIAPRCLEDYITCQGSTRLLLLIEWCIGADDYGGHGNSFHGTGGRGNKRAQMRYCIRLLRSICSQGDEQVLADLSDQNTIAELVGILQSASSSPDENDSIDIELQCDMMFILASLCDGDLHRKELFGENGVQMLVNYLGRYPEKIVSPLGQHRLMLAAVDCVWSSVVGCFVNETAFLEKEGLFLLLDLLEVCPENMRNLVLGAILDICENPRALPHVKLWRGKEDCTVGQLLIKIWRHEEVNLGISRDLSGVILDAKKPILSSLQEKQGIISLPSSFPSPAVVDVSENIRAKIYSMFCKLGFNNVPGLHTSDYITLSIVERYLEFKTLEVWLEIRSELEQEGIRAISPDRDCIDTIIQTLEERAQSVTSVQKMLVEAESSNNLIDEEECYEKIKESHKQEEKSLKDFSDFVERTSDYRVLQKARQKQLETIAHSRLRSRGESRDNEHTHETIDTRIKTTSFCGRSVLIESTPPEFTGKFVHENKLQRELEQEIMTVSQNI
eukprot:gene14666-5755_t